MAGQELQGKPVSRAVYEDAQGSGRRDGGWL